MFLIMKIGRNKYISVIKMMFISSKGMSHRNGNPFTFTAIATTKNIGSHVRKYFSAFIAIFLHFAFNLITCFAWNSLSEAIHITVIIIVIICSLIVDINISISMPPTRINHYNYASSKTSITIKTTVIVFLIITSIFNMELLWCHFFC